MAFCMYCGRENAEGTIFCAYCGRAVYSIKSNAQRKTVTAEEFHKCSNCGWPLDSFVTSCPACGYVLRGTKPESNVQESVHKKESTDSGETVHSTNSNAQRKTVYAGELHKCPNCGELLDSIATICPSCGYVLRSATPVSSVHDSVKKKESTDSGNVVHNNSSSQRKTVYAGELHKCPNCGKLLDSFVAECPACGYELRGAKTTSSVHELAKKLEWIASDELKIDIIRNFYIPNTKEDIQEFFILAISNINAGGYDVDAWYVKLEQAYQKARLSFGDTPEFEYLSQLYNEAQKQKKGKAFIRSVKKSKLLQGILLGALGVIMVIVGSFGSSSSGNSGSFFSVIKVLGILTILVAFLYSMGGSQKNRKND